MTVKCFPNNKDEFVGCEPLMKFLHGRTSGVFAADGNARVSAKAPAAMAVVVSDGIGWISNNHGNGVAWWIESSAETGSPLELAIDTAGLALPRIDRVVLTWPTINYAENPTVTILKGAEASNPVAPALTNNGTMRQISLARILIPAGALTVTPDMIYDERLDPAVCGLVTEAVSVDTASINAQLTLLIEKLQDNIQAVQDGSAYVFKTGDTMTGPLKLPTPQDNEDAVPKGFMVQSIRNSLTAKTVILRQSGWSGTTQTISVPEFHAGAHGTYGPSGTKANVEMYTDSRIFIQQEREGTLVFGFVDKPTSDVSVDLLFQTGGGNS